MSEEKPDLDQLLSVYEAYLISKISPEILCRLCEAFIIPAQVVGNVWKIKRFDLELYLLEQKMKYRQSAPPPTEPSEFINLSEASQITGLTTHSLALLCGKQFPATRLGKLDWLIKRSDFEAYLEKKKKPAVGSDKPDLEQLLTLEEASQISDISEKGLRHLCQTYTIPAHKEADAWLIKRFDLELYLIERRMAQERVNSEAFEAMLASEEVLGRLWNSPEEDEAWKDL